MIKCPDCEEMVDKTDDFSHKKTHERVFTNFSTPPKKNFFFFNLNLNRLHAFIARNHSPLWNLTPTPLSVPKNQNTANSAKYHTRSLNLNPTSRNAVVGQDFVNYAGNIFKCGYLQTMRSPVFWR